MSSAECRFRPAMCFIVPSSPISGHRTLKLVGLIQWEHARITEVRLSDEVGEVAAKQTSARISAVKGASGGRFYINEECELFGPVAANDYENFVYIGHLEDSAWFGSPEGYS